MCIYIQTYSHTDNRHTEYNYTLINTFLVYLFILFSLGYEFLEKNYTRIKMYSKNFSCSTILQI